MKFLIIVVSNNNRICDFFNDRFESVIPVETRKAAAAKGHNLSLQVFNPKLPGGLCDFLLARKDNYDAFVCFVERNEYDHVENTGNALFIAFFNPDEINSSLQNYFSAKIGILLKNFIFLTENLFNGRNMPMFLLPKRVFNAPEVSDFCGYIKDYPECSTFRRRVQNYIGDIGRRKSPKRKGQNPKDKFFKDDSMHFFQFGYEKHAIAEEGGQHLLSCKLEKYFRFGVRIIDNRHFNLTKENRNSKINDHFYICHGLNKKKFGPKTHLNVFPNGFIA